MAGILVEIDRQSETRGAGGRMRIGNPAFQGAAIDFGFHSVEGDAIGGYADIALQAQGLLPAIGDRAAALQPRCEGIRIARLDAERALEAARRPTLRGL